jgi:hypothetical protein
MRRIQYGRVGSHIPQVWDSWACRITTSKFQHLRAPLTTLRNEMVMCSILWCIGMSVCQMLLFLSCWTHHLPILFHILDHVSTRDILAPVEIHTNWERFRSLASQLISLRIQIDTVDVAERAVYNFAASVASAYRLPTRKITLSELNNLLPELDSLLQLKQGLRKLWHETREPACKTVVNRATKTLRRMTWRKHLNDGQPK